MPLGLWVSSVLAPFLAVHSHVCKDTPTVLKQIDGWIIGDGDLLVKADVKDFYLSGTPNQINGDLDSSVEDQKRRSLFAETFCGAL